MLEAEGRISGIFDVVSGIGSDSEVLEHFVAGHSRHQERTRKVPGRLAWNSVTLRRAVSDLLDLWNWRQLVIDGRMDEARMTCTITAQDGAGRSLARWTLVHAWPSQVVQYVEERESGVRLLEAVTLTCEGVRREQV